MAFNAIIDPFEKNGVVKLGLAKKRHAVKRHGPLYKAIEYSRRQSAYVVFGDSRGRALREKLFRESRFPADVYNFAYGGGTLPEMVDSFWYAARHGTLKGVVLGVPLRIFTMRYKNGKNQFTEAREILGEPMRYYKSLSVAETGVDLLEAHYRPVFTAARELGSILARALPLTIASAHSAPPSTERRLEAPRNLLPGATGPSKTSGHPRSDQEPKTANATHPPLPLERPGRNAIDGAVSFSTAEIPPAFVAADEKASGPPPLPKEAKTARRWHHQISKAARNDWERFDFSESYFEEIRKIVQYCERNGIAVVLFIPPTPIEMQQRLLDFDRAADILTFKIRLAALAPVLDFDFPNGVTADSSNFNDAYHFNAKLAREITHEIVRQFNVPADVEARSVKHRRQVRCPLPRASALDLPLEGVAGAVLGSGCVRWGRSSSRDALQIAKTIAAPSL